MRQRLHPGPGVIDVGGVAALGNDPRRSLVFRSSLDLAERHALDVMVRHVGGRPNPANQRYTAVDLRWGWQVTRQVELSLTLENLTDRQHAEWGGAPNRVELERAAHLKLLVQL